MRWFGDLSEFEFSYCRPLDDTVGVLSTRPRHDNLGEPWLYVVVTGLGKGERVGWIQQRHLEVLNSRGAADVRVRPAHG